jgi:hypothetical protein
MIRRAEREENPKMIEPFDIAQLIRCEEREINAYMSAARKSELEDRRREREAKQNGVGERGAEKGKQKDLVDWETGKEEGKGKKLDSPHVMQVDDKGGPTGYSGPVSVPTTHSNLADTIFRSILSSHFLIQVAIQRVG